MLSPCCLWEHVDGQAEAAQPPEELVVCGGGRPCCLTVIRELFKSTGPRGAPGSFLNTGTGTTWLLTAHNRQQSCVAQRPSLVFCVAYSSGSHIKKQVFFFFSFQPLKIRRSLVKIQIPSLWEAACDTWPLDGADMPSFHTVPSESRCLSASSLAVSSLG